MSWSIFALGHPKRVKAIIEEQAHARWDPKPPDENTQQKRLAAALLLAHIDSLKPSRAENNCVNVAASGHLHDGIGNLKLEVHLVTVHLDEPEPVATVPAASPVLTVTAAPGQSVAEAIVAALPVICPDCGQSDSHSRGCSKF